MTCTDCAQAQTIKHWGGYHANCRGCKVRALAHSPSHFESRQANAMTASYRNALRAAFGEGWREAHDEIKAEHERLKGMA